MNKYVLGIVFIITTLSVFGAKKAKPVFTTVSNKEVVMSVFNDAQKVEQLNDYWFEILDGKEKQLGYAMTSLNYCKNVIGYQKNTPVMIITDKKFKIIKVALLSHWESLSYVKKLNTNGFFDLWNMKTLKQAQSVKLDGITGATATAKAIEKNVHFLLANGLENLPKRN